MEPVFILFLVVLIAALAWLGWRWERKRREAFQRLADELGLAYLERESGLATRYEFLDALYHGSNRYAFNILSGEFEGHPVKAFDYHYEKHSTDSKGRRQTHHHYFSFFLLELGASFPELRIFEESFFARIGEMLGFDDIDFESVEFSNAFTVKSTDKKFAYDICHTRMMEYLLANRDLSIEIENDCLAIAFPDRLNPEEIQGRLRQLVEIRTLFPEYLFRSGGGTLL